jgi:hypothetical protein
MCKISIGPSYDETLSCPVQLIKFLINCPYILKKIQNESVTSAPLALGFANQPNKYLVENTAPPPQTNNKLYYALIID